MTLSENHIFSTSLLNTVRFSFSRFNAVLLSPATGNNGETGPQYSFVPGQPMGQIVDYRL